MEGKNQASFGNGVTFLSFGASYYLPLDFYVGLDLRYLFFGKKDKTQLQKTTESSDGISYLLAVGKEFVVADNYGLGIALTYTVNNTQTKTKSDARLGSKKQTQKNSLGLIGLAFSASFH